MDRRTELLAQAQEAHLAYQQEVERVQAACAHPLDQLQFASGATEIHCSGFTDRDIYVRCKACDAQFTRSVRWHDD